MFGKGTVVQVVEPVSTLEKGGEWDCVLHRTYEVESAVEEPPEERISGEEFVPFYWLNAVPDDGVAYSAPHWAVMQL